MIQLSTIPTLVSVFVSVTTTLNITMLNVLKIIIFTTYTAQDVIFYTTEFPSLF